ncbi:uncharacterized protein DUF2637 [Streptomyces sp. CG 926]|uniref:DUF2637 domain-containing protein n=1 Tax=Streptomyces sp. CG 926 TaxID=1882405 RepID=UPI000D7A495F|nr:DUF2637 domain-containing protein [Streptomyces sp. CG 926]PWK73024.1 uncharacterized protein DUF2637 [Streptomyces sp. CG 926]
MAAMQLTRTHRILIGVVVAGAVVIAGIGFAGSYSAVRALALQKGFGSFSLVFPIGIDAGICVLLALDLLLTWLRIPFPLLRQTAWLLTAATIAFNGAASWPDPLGVGMHAVIPMLFVVTVEAARHAVGRIADITADRHMEGVRITRWLLSPIPTFKLWRRMKLWELRSYEQAVGMEQDRLIYQARLQARYGRSWRRKAPVEALMPLKLAKIGVPLAETTAEALAATGIEPAVLPPVEQQGQQQLQQALAPAAAVSGPAQQAQQAQQAVAQGQPGQQAQPGQPQPQQGPAGAPGVAQHAPPAFAVDPTAMPAAHNSAWFAAPLAPQAAYEGGYNPQYVEGLEPTPVLPPMGPDEERPAQQELPIPAPRQEEVPAQAPADGPETPDEAEFAEAAYKVFCALSDEKQDYPSVEALDIHLSDGYGVTHPRSGSLLRRMIPAFKLRYNKDREAEHIA